MPTEPSNPDEQPSQAQPQPQPQTEQRPRPSPPIKLRQPTKWPDHPPRPDALLAIIRKLAEEGRFGFLDHADERLLKRGFDIFDVLEALKKGYIVGPIDAGKKEGEWKTKVVDEVEGTSRQVGVVTIVVKNERVLIKTVEWEDR